MRMRFLSRMPGAVRAKKLSPNYANTLQPLALSLNGCKTPVYTTTAEIPENVDTKKPPKDTAPPEATEPPVSCGARPPDHTYDLEVWCACMGGTVYYDPDLLCSTP